MYNISARHFHLNHVSLTFTSCDIMKATNEEEINISVTFIFSFYTDDDFVYT